MANVLYINRLNDTCSHITLLAQALGNIYIYIYKNKLEKERKKKKRPEFNQPESLQNCLRLKLSSNCISSFFTNLSKEPHLQRERIQLISMRIFHMGEQILKCTAGKREKLHIS